MRYVIEASDFDKMQDALEAAARFHVFRDKMNAEGHLARETRYSPLTSTLMAARDRAEAIKSDPGNALCP